MSFTTLFLSFVLAAEAIVPRDPFKASCYNASDVIRRDVAIIGGGAAGTYASIALKDRGLSSVIVELTDRLGGHAATYDDPVTGGHVDFGVQLYLNCSVVNDFFARLKVPLKPVSFSSFGTPKVVDYATAQLVPGYNGNSLGQDYIDELHKYPYIENGIDLPKPVPSDLLLTWPEYISKFNLSTLSAYAAFSRPASPGDLLTDLALYVFNDLNTLMLQENRGGAVKNGNNDNSEIFKKALVELQNDVLLNSMVIATKRSTNNKKGGIQLVVKTPQGNKLVIANQLLLAMPPTTDNTVGFDLDKQESTTLSKIYGSYYYGGVVKSTGLNDTNSYPNRGLNTPYHVANIPSIVMFNPSAVPDHHYYWYNTLTKTSQADVEKAARDSIKTLQNLFNTTTKPEPEFLKFADFSPFHLVASKKDIQNGFYTAMNGLQGHRGTWYIGTLFIPGSTQVWNNTLNMLPAIIKGAKA